jgi:hypothetical protein
MFLMRSGVMLVTLAVLAAAAPARAGSASARECIDANESAIRLRKDHKLVAARDQFAICALEACPAEIRAECSARLKDVNDSIPTIVFEAMDSAGNDLTEVEVHVDGKPLVPRLDGTALPLDPGPHTFTFEAANKPFVSKNIVLHEGEKSRHERIVFSAETVQAPPQPKPPVESSGQRTIGFVVAGAGVVSLALGGYFGLRAKSAWSDSQAACAGPTDCPDHAKAVSDHDKASNAATLSTIFFAAGGAAVALGGVLWFTAPEVTPGEHKTALIHVGGVF